MLNKLIKYLLVLFTCTNFIDCVDDRLFLTPLIEQGRLEYAKNLSMVTNLLGDRDISKIVSYAGYFTVNKEFNSNLFMWFFPALSSKPNAPVLVWLQGGPGSSSLIGVFNENGPFVITKELMAIRRNVTWINDYNLLYIDQPVGAGYSYTENDKGYANNEDDVAKDLYNAIQQFFTMFNELRNNSFYISGESYAGKYIPSLAHHIHNQGANSNINLKGILIGDGLIDPINQDIKYPEYLYSHGLIDDNQKNYLNEHFNKVNEFIKNEDYLNAYKLRDQFIDGSGFVRGTSIKTVLRNMTGLNDVYNFDLDNIPESYHYYENYTQLAQTKSALHVGDQNFTKNGKLFEHLITDIMRSVADKLVVILNNDYKVCLYYGQLDIIDNYMNGRNFLWNLNWKHLDEYRNAKQSIWRVNGKVAGYIRQVVNLKVALVRNAGHMAPMDRPTEVHELIKMIINE